MKVPIDPNFPSFKTKINIDGRQSKSNHIHKPNKSVLKIPTIDNNLLGFGPIPRSNGATSSTEGLQQLGKITVDVFNCEKTGKTNRVTSAANNRPHQHSVKKEVNKFEMQSTKWKTVSAGAVPPPIENITINMGPFRSSISLQYMDWATMEHNRRVTAPVATIVPEPEVIEIIQPEPEVLEIIQPEMKPDPEFIDLTAQEGMQVARPGRGVKREPEIFDLT